MNLCHSSVPAGTWKKPSSRYPAQDRHHQIQPLHLPSQLHPRHLRSAHLTLAKNPLNLSPFLLPLKPSAKMHAGSSRRRAIPSRSRSAPSARFSAMFWTMLRSHFRISLVLLPLSSSRVSISNARVMLRDQTRMEPQVRKLRQQYHGSSSLSRYRINSVYGGLHRPRPLLRVLQVCFPPFHLTRHLHGKVQIRTSHLICSLILVIY